LVSYFSGCTLLLLFLLLLLLLLVRMNDDAECNNASGYFSCDGGTRTGGGAIPSRGAS
jgi:hypothetical protein